LLEPLFLKVIVFCQVLWERFQFFWGVFIIDNSFGPSNFRFPRRQPSKGEITRRTFVRKEPVFQINHTVKNKEKNEAKMDSRNWYFVTCRRSHVYDVWLSAIRQRRGPNVLTNADMESGTTNWVVNGAGTHSVNDEGRRPAS
jgi:hypothetical protein